jgi:molybdopterin converting factor subunit 1
LNRRLVRRRSRKSKWRSDVHFGASTMTITVLLFASYADALGRPRIEVPLAVGATVAQMVASVRAAGDPARLPSRPLVAVNQEYASYDRILEPGDEVALIPPVAGG